jgi:hypothetical protein
MITILHIKWQVGQYKIVYNVIIGVLIIVIAMPLVKCLYNITIFSEKATL